MRNLIPLLAILVYIPGLMLRVFDVDSAQYATISLEMLRHGNFLEITENGADYLDKPPLLFWLAVLSFKIFGVSSFAFKLPSLVASLAGLYYTYRLGAHLYNRRVGLHSAAVLGTCIGFLWITTDVKTDALLMSCTIFSIYYLVRYVDHSKWIYLIWASVGMGLAMLTKGPIGLVFPIVVLFIHSISQGALRKVLKFRTLIILPIVAILLLPMCVGLYQQFDLHPEKVVHGRTGISGLRFYFFEQSFGRITGDSGWSNSAGFLYLFQVAVLLIFPYSILFLLSVWQKIRSLIYNKQLSEYVSLPGTILLLIGLSLSNYKIPHYAMLAFPLLSIVVGSEWAHWEKKKPKWLYGHHVVLGLLVINVIILGSIAFRTPLSVMVLCTMLVILYFLFVVKRRTALGFVCLAWALGWYFNAGLLPAVQSFTEGERMTDLVIKEVPEQASLYYFKWSSRAIEFNTRRQIDQVSEDDLNNLKTTDCWLITSSGARNQLHHLNMPVNEEFAIKRQGLSRIKKEFLYPQTRQNSLETIYLVHLSPASLKQL